MFLFDDVIIIYVALAHILAMNDQLGIYEYWFNSGNI